MVRGNTVIKIPAGLAHELDRIAGARRRSAYAVDVLWRDVRRSKQREALRATTAAWRAEDHPELVQGSAAYVERIRSEPDERFEAALQRHKN